MRTRCEWLFILLVTASASSCASSKYTAHSPVSGDQVFAYGAYRHRVSVTIFGANAAGNRSIDLDGIVRLSGDMVRLVALSPVGTTLYRVTDDRKTGHVEAMVYAEELKPIEDRLREYYVLLRNVLTARSEEEWGAAPELRVVVEGRDSNGHPQRFTIEHAMFRASIEVTGYEP